MSYPTTNATPNKTATRSIKLKLLPEILRVAGLSTPIGNSVSALLGDAAP